MKIDKPFAVDYRVWGEDPRWDEYTELLLVLENDKNSQYGAYKKKFPFFGVDEFCVVDNRGIDFFNNNIISLDEALAILKPHKCEDKDCGKNESGLCFKGNCTGFLQGFPPTRAEGELIKLSDSHYILVDDSDLHEEEYAVVLPEKRIFKTDKGWNSNLKLHIVKKITHSTELLEGVEPLSLKNCQAIERGYDLDDMAKKFCENLDEEDGEAWSNDYEELPKRMAEFARKALEILGDKKFSEENMVKMFFLGRESLDKALVTEQEAKSVIQSLQQTEWDVVIIEEPADLAFYENGNRFPMNADLPERFKYKPPLDADGCIILKRK